MISSQCCVRTQPEFGLGPATTHMDMRRFTWVTLIRIKEESIIFYTKYYRHVKSASWPFLLNNQYHRVRTLPTR